MVAPNPVFLTIGSIKIMWYGFLIGIGFLSAFLIAYKVAPKHDISRDFILDVVIVSLPSAIIGARLYYVIFSWESYKNNLSEIFNIRGGGLAVHGGLILCFIAGYILCRRKKTDFLKVADLCASVIPLGQAIGRWGNFFNEEAHGGPTSLPWAQIINGVGYHPTFLYESIWCMGLSVFLITLYSKGKAFKGQILSLYMILYSFERFFVEGLRTDSLMIGPLRQAQVISLFFFLSGLALYIFSSKRETKNISK